MIKNPPANAGDKRDSGLIPGLERSLAGGHGSPLQYSYLENLMDREPGGLQSIWWQRVRHDSTHTYTDIISSENNKTHKFNSLLVKRH